MSDLPAPQALSLPPVTNADGEREAPIRLRVYEAGEGPAVVLCHGFPELAYSWRHQFQALVDAGFRVIAPNQRGYAGSSAPEDSDAYDIDHLNTDLVGVLDSFGIEKAVFVGHDWGGFVTWSMPILHPDRVAGVIGVNTPYLPRMPIPPTELMKQMVGGDPERHYIVWFQEPGVAEKALDQHPRLVFEKLMRRPVSLEDFAKTISENDASPDLNPFKRIPEMDVRGDDLLSAKELDHYTEAFTESGFRGPVSWYRNFDRNWERHPEIGAQTIQQPCLMVTAEWDVVLPPSTAEPMPERIPDLETVMIEGCGHWTQQEKPAELNAILIDWLTRRFL